MKTKEIAQWAGVIEQDARQRIGVAVARDSQRKSAVQAAACELWAKHFPKKGAVNAEGIFISRHILVGGMAAVEKAEWPLEKALRPLCIGLLNATLSKQKNFIEAAEEITRAAIQAALLADYDACKMTEEVVGAILKAGQDKKYKSGDLLKTISRSAVLAARSAPQKKSDLLEPMLMDLLEGKIDLSVDEEE